MSLPGDPYTSEAIFLLSAVTIFIIIALDLSLLKRQKVKATIWIGPLISLYLLASIFLTIFGSVAAGSIDAIVNYAAILITLVAGFVVGTMIGHQIPLSGEPDGSKWYVGGQMLVAIVVGLLLPRAIEQAALLVSSFYSSNTPLANLASNQYLLAADTLTAALVIFGVFLSIGWRIQVWKRQADAPAPRYQQPPRGQQPYYQNPPPQRQPQYAAPPPAYRNPNYPPPQYPPRTQ